MADVRQGPGIYRFESFVADAAERRLSRDGEPLEISSRYFDALILMLDSPGELIRRERFLDEAWKGVPVTDEALSQCIAQLRRILGDEAARPRLIETVPKHGYRFIAAVENQPVGQVPAPSAKAANPAALQIAGFAFAGGIGGGLAGVAAGLLYGLGASPDPLQPAVGAASLLLVMLSVNILAGAIGGLAVGLGMGVAHQLTRPTMPATALGAAAGGLVVGLAAKLLGTDAFTVLLGSAPKEIAGGFEGFVLGGAIGLGSHLSLGRARPWPSIGGAAFAAAGGGALLPLIGGHLMAGSLAALSETFPGGLLNVDSLGRWFGEETLGRRSAAVLGAIEGLLFGAGVMLAIGRARILLRDLARR